MQDSSGKEPPATDPKIRAAFISAGYKLCKSHKLSDVTPALLAAEAGISVPDFFANFGGMHDYFMVLQLHFLDDLRSQIVAATMNSPPGAERLRAATCAFLDGCLAQRPLRAWLLELRSSDAAAYDSLSKRNKVYCQLLKIEFDSLGVKNSEAASRLFFCMTQEVSYAEHLVSKALPDMRETMLDFLRIAGPI